MNIYVNSDNRTVSNSIPVENTGDIAVEIYDGDELVASIDNAIYDDGVYSFILPFRFSQADKSYDVRWKFNYSENNQSYEYDEYTELSVVTPILPLSEIKKIIESDDEEEAASIERAVRYIIQAHTGQFFGKYIGKNRVTGSGQSSLRMPYRLVKITSINGSTFWNQNIALRGGGWYLESKTYGVPSIRADLDGWHENPWTSPVPIGAPHRHRIEQFLNNVEYEIDGVWGWSNVPSAVQEAARLLVNDYACSDSMYRDRFLASIQAADWRLQFDAGAFAATGNVRADQLLAQFVVRRGWLVL